MVDVDHDGVHRHFREVPVEPFHVTHKIIDIEQFCQRIPLCGLDQVPGLGKLDTLAHAGFDDFRAGIGFRNKIHGAEMQAFHLRLLVPGQYDHRNIPQRRIGHHDPEDLHPVHFRHHQIQQHQRNPVLLLPEHCQGFSPVRSEPDIVFLFQNCSEQHPVDLDILCDKDGFPYINHPVHTDLPLSDCPFFRIIQKTLPAGKLIVFLSPI